MDLGPTAPRTPFLAQDICRPDMGRKTSQRQELGLTLDITSRHTGTRQAEPPLPLPLPLECPTQDSLGPSSSTGYSKDRDSGCPIS